MLGGLIVAAVLTSAGAGGVNLSVEAESTQIDPARSVFLTVTLKTPHGVVAELPDLRDRVVGFSLAEDFVEEPVTEPDGTRVQTANWRLVPEPCADDYRLRPLVVGSFYTPAVHFAAPDAREPVTGEMEADPTTDLPPLSWKLAGRMLAAVLAFGLLAVGGWWLVRLMVRKVREHRMSPIERAWVELDRLLKKGLPGRGRYKDFYVELTMVVRRYIQRKYGIKAPNLTTEEFLATVPSLTSATEADRQALARFLTSADLIKFAGVEATPEMADEATESARGYLRNDAEVRT